MKFDHLDKTKDLARTLGMGSRQSLPCDVEEQSAAWLPNKSSSAQSLDAARKPY
jgi:hypothetical protein